MTPMFKKGDRVRLRFGGASILILEVRYFESNEIRRTRTHKNSTVKTEAGWYVRWQYFSSLHYDKEGKSWRTQYDFIMVEQMKSDQFYDPLSWENYPNLIQAAQEYHCLMNESNPKEATMALYQTKEETPRFGTFLTKTSAGKIVLEMKGKDKDVESFDPGQVEEVMPYTVKVVAMHGGGEPQNPATKQIEMTKGEVEVDDLLIHVSTGRICKVVEIDTKVRNPTKSKNGYVKLNGPVIGKT